MNRLWRNAKGRIRRIWKLLGILLLLLYFLPLSMRLIPSGMKQEGMLKLKHDCRGKLLDTFIRNGNQTIHVLATGNDTARVLLLIHGSPGSWSDLADYLRDTFLQQHYRILVYDRPGFGSSSAPDSFHIRAQAAAAATVLSLGHSRRKPIVLAHSYGGAVALCLAAMHPQEIGAMLLVSPTVDPVAEAGIRIKRAGQWYTRFWPVSWMFPDVVHHSTAEMRPLPEQMRALEPALSDIRFPVAEYHGTADWIAPFANQRYVVSKLSGAKVITRSETGGDHFLIWKNHQTVVNLLEQISN